MEWWYIHAAVRPAQVQRSRRCRPIVKQGQHPIVHVVVGEDFDSGSPGNPPASIFGNFAINMEAIINLAHQNNIRLIVGTVPFTIHNSVAYYNAWLKFYCATHGVPVVDYESAITSSSTQMVGRINPVSLIPTLTAAGYALVTGLAQAQIALTSQEFKLTRGYLGTVIYQANGDPATVVGGNTAEDGSSIVFTAYGQYSDGTTRIVQDGIWTSSNPEVVHIDPVNGVAQAWSPGTADIHFASNSGVTFNGWTMHTVLGFGQGFPISPF